MGNKRTAHPVADFLSSHGDAPFQASKMVFADVVVQNELKHQNYSSGDLLIN
jgi:hypothetical protein